MEQSVVANADSQTPNADDELSSNTKNSQKAPEELKNSLTEVSGSLEDLITDLEKMSETSQERQNLPSAKDDNISLNERIDAEPSITTSRSSIRRAEHEAAVTKRKEQEEFERQEQEVELELEMKKIAFEKKRLAELKRKTQLKADLRKLDSEFSDKSSARSSSTTTRSNSLPLADDRSHLSSWLDSLNGCDEQMVTEKNDQSEGKLSKMSTDMQRKLASVDEDANTLNYEPLRQFLNQDLSRERSVK